MIVLAEILATARRALTFQGKSYSADDSVALRVATSEYWTHPGDDPPSTPYIPGLDPDLERRAEALTTRDGAPALTFALASLGELRLENPEGRWNVLRHLRLDGAEVLVRVAEAPFGSEPRLESFSLRWRGTVRGRPRVDGERVELDLVSRFASRLRRDVHSERWPGFGRRLAFGPDAFAELPFSLEIAWTDRLSVAVLAWGGVGGTLATQRFPKLTDLTGRGWAIERRGPGAFSIQLDTSDASAAVQVDAPAPEVPTWVAFRYDGATLTGWALAHGEEIPTTASVPLTGPLGTFEGIEINDAVYLGADPRNAGAHWPGALAHVLLFSEPIDEETFRKLATTDPTQPRQLPNLVRDYPLDDGFGDRAAEHVDGRDAKLSGTTWELSDVGPGLAGARRATFLGEHAFVQLQQLDPVLTLYDLAGAVPERLYNAGLAAIHGEHTVTGPMRATPDGQTLTLTGPGTFTPLAPGGQIELSGSTLNDGTLTLASVRGNVLGILEPLEDEEISSATVRALGAGWSVLENGHAEVRTAAASGAIVARLEGPKPTLREQVEHVLTAMSPALDPSELVFEGEVWDAPSRLAIPPEPLEAFDVLERLLGNLGVLVLEDAQTITFREAILPTLAELEIPPESIRALEPIHLDGEPPAEIALRWNVHAYRLEPDAILPGSDVADLATARHLVRATLDADAEENVFEPLEIPLLGEQAATTAAERLAAITRAEPWRLTLESHRLPFALRLGDAVRVSWGEPSTPAERRLGFEDGCVALVLGDAEPLVKGERVLLLLVAPEDA